MPLFPPRNEPIKKREQLLQRKNELQSAIRNNLSFEKINKFVEKYRMAQLAVLKARIHELKEKEFANKKSNTNVESIEKEIFYWTNKSAKEIIKEVES